MLLAKLQTELNLAINKDARYFLKCQNPYILPATCCRSNSVRSRPERFATSQNYFFSITSFMLTVGFKTYNTL